MPSTLPFGVVLLGSLKFVAKVIKKGFSFLFAAFLWSFLVPVISAQIFRYYFGFSLQGLLQLTPLRFVSEFSSPEELQQYAFESTIYLLFDVVQGLLICGLTVFLGLGLLLTRELQSMVRPLPEEASRESVTSDFEEAEELRQGLRFRSSAARNATSPNEPIADASTPPPPSPMQNQNVFSPQAQQLFTEIARLEEALNGSESPNPASTTGGGYWLDRVHPKEYKRYVQRSNLQRQMMSNAEAEHSAAVADESFTWSSPNFDDHLSNISGNTTLRTTATTRTSANIDSIRCRICSSTTCINRDHVIQASRMRFAAVAARNQALIDEVVEFGDLNRPASAASRPVEHVNSGPSDSTLQQTLTQVTRPRTPQAQPQQEATQEEEWRINLDADTITLAEFFGFSTEGTNILELLQNAAIVAGCNALVMIVFLCLPCLFGSIVLKVKEHQTIKVFFI